MTRHQLKKRIKELKMDFSDDYQDSEGNWETIVNWEKLAYYIDNLWQSALQEAKRSRKEKRRER